MQVAFYKAKGRFLNRLISWWIRGPYSHCELILGYECDGTAICASSSIMDGGVRIKHMELNPDHWDLVEAGGDPGLAWMWALRREGQGYDYCGVFGFMSRLFTQSKRRWFCSEAVAAMLGFYEPWRYDPCTLYSAITRPADAGFFVPGGECEN